MDSNTKYFFYFLLGVILYLFLKDIIVEGFGIELSVMGKILNENENLGCINHALLTVEAIKRSGLPFYGWVANHIVDNTESDAIIDSLKAHISAPCLGVIPVLPKGQVMMDYLTLLDAAKP